MLTMTIQELHDACIRFRFKLEIDHSIQSLDNKETEKRADTAMLKALQLEREINGQKRSI